MGGGAGSRQISPEHSPEIGTMDFEENKLARGGALLLKLKGEIRQASEWLYEYYQGADKYAGITSS